MHADVDLSDLQARVTAELPPSLRTTRFVVDVASATVTSYNPMAEDGLVAIYDPLLDRVEHSRTAELVARLPQFSQQVRVFSNDEDALGPLHEAARRALA